MPRGGCSVRDAPRRVRGYGRGPLEVVAKGSLERSIPLSPLDPARIALSSPPCSSRISPRSSPRRGRRSECGSRAPARVRAARTGWRALRRACPAWSRRTTAPGAAHWRGHAAGRRGVARARHPVAAGRPSRNDQNSTPTGGIPTRCAQIQASAPLLRRVGARKQPPRRWPPACAPAGRHVVGLLHAGSPARG